jgi:ABC-2 type transport system permease protein
VIGAAFVIGLQVAAIVSSDTLSRIGALHSATFVALAPDGASVLYWPARAVLGDLAALLVVFALGAAVLALSIATLAPRFGDHVIAAAGSAGTPAARRRPPTAFVSRPAARALRRKEWMLLLRDPWLASQSLMQILYLLPPALLLWKSLGDGHTLLVVVPVLAMAAGQLAGGLAWLAVSGEDAPDLVATAPVPAGAITRAKVEAVLGAIAVVFLPFVAALALLSPWHAAVAAAGIAVAAVSATQIQLWFRGQARRSQFRRRQVSSRVATLAEAFSSIGWAATAALAAAGTWLALVAAALAAATLMAARALAPR